MDDDPTGMNDDLSALMGSQHGLVLRRQAYDAGLSPAQVDRRRRQGDWVAVRQGVYAGAALWESLDPFVGRPRLRVLAASLAMKAPHVLSHDSAALMLGMPVLLGEPELVHVTRWLVLGGRTTTGVKHHRAPMAPCQIEEVDDIPVLDAARTAVDIAREHGERHGLVACDSALRRGVPRAGLWAAVAPMVCWPGVTVVRRCIELADAGAESVGESLLRLMVLGLGIGEVQTQFGLRGHGRDGWCDLRVGRHVFEFDGRVKYRPVEDGGLARRPPEEVLWREKLRQDWLTGFRLGTSRVTWADLTPRQWRATERRLLQEYTSTHDALGVSIADLAPFVIRREGGVGL